jgi:hypothetical protein
MRWRLFPHPFQPVLGLADNDGRAQELATVQLRALEPGSQVA